MSRPRWRDPRLVLGVLLVFACMLLGARLLAGAEDYVDVWSARRDLPAGSTLRMEDLQATQIRFRDQADADRYLPQSEIPPDAALSRSLGAGELVPRAAVQVAGSASRAELPLGVAEWAVPVDLAAGDVVDVWVVPSADVASMSAGSQGGAADSTPLAQQVLSSVVVRSAGSEASGIGGAGMQTVVVDVDEAARLPSVLPTLASGNVVLIRLGS